jgi:hypothetical protein
VIDLQRIRRLDGRQTDEFGCPMKLTGVIEMRGSAKTIMTRYFRCSAPVLWVENRDSVVLVPSDSAETPVGNTSSISPK